MLGISSLSFMDHAQAGSILFNQMCSTINTKTKNKKSCPFWAYFLYFKCCGLFMEISAVNIFAG